MSVRVIVDELELEYAPEGIVEQTGTRATTSPGQVGLAAFASLLWSGTRVFDNLTRAMNVTCMRWLSIRTARLRL